MKTAASTVKVGSQPAAHSAKTVLKKHGKSFHFAGKFLPSKSFDRCARLYHFCRFLDDISDESTDTDLAKRQLNEIENDLLKPNRRHLPVTDFLDLASECDFSIGPAVELVRGVKSDLVGVVAFSTDADLKQYSYRVAGTVGLMMCGVLGVKSPTAFRHAIDLGMAMQLTNIARDVTADAQIGRRYLPATRFHQLPSTKALAAGHPETHEEVRHIVCWLLDEADKYYDSGIAGLAYLPFRARLGILVAARLYQYIGAEIRRCDFAIWEGRAHVSFLRKVVIATRTFGYFCRHRGLRVTPSNHDSELHRHLAGLPLTETPPEEKSPS